MKKIKLLALPILALSLAGCGEDPSVPDNGTIEDLIPTEFDFSNFSRQAVFDVLDGLQHNSGFQISFKVSHYDDINADPSIVTDVVIGGKDSYTWAYETTDGVTYGAASKVEADLFTFYILKDGAWKYADEVEYQGEDIAKEASDFINEEFEKVVVDNDYISKIDFSHSTGSTSICSRSCYTFSYNQEYYLSVALDKALGVTMSLSVTYVDVARGIATRDCVEVQSFALSNIEIPAFPSK